MLPFPSVTFSDVAVGGGPDGEPAMTVEEFSMDAELAPFMRGEFLIFDMRLVRPKVTIESPPTARSTGRCGRRRRSIPAQIAIEKLTITEGQVAHPPRRQRPRPSDLGDQRGSLGQVARRPVARWTARCASTACARRSSVSTGKVGREGRDAAAHQGRSGRSIRSPSRADGDVRIDRRRGEICGHVQDRGARRGTATAADAATAAPAPAKAEPPAWRVNGKFALDHQRLALDEFRFETGPLDNPYTADGKASVDLGADPRFAVTATGAQVRFDEAVGAGQGAAG